MVVAKSHKLSLEKMECIAKEATRSALMGYTKPSPEEEENLTLGTEINDREGIFELYIAGSRPEDAKVISCATVNRMTGEVAVEVFLSPMSPT